MDYFDNTYDSDSEDNNDKDYCHGHVADHGEELDDADDFEPIHQSQIDELLADDFEELPDLVTQAPDPPAATPVPPPARAVTRGPSC